MGTASQGDLLLTLRRRRGHRRKLPPVGRELEVDSTAVHVTRLKTSQLGELPIVAVLKEGGAGVPVAGWIRKWVKTW